MSEQSSLTRSSSAPGQTPGASAGQAGNAGKPGKAAPRWLLVAGVLLAVIAFRGLLSFGSAQSASRELEDWFFAASDTAPLVVLALSAWLLYRRWGRLLALPDSPSANLGGPGGAGGGSAWRWLAPVLPFFVAGIAMLAWATLTAATDLVAVALLLVAAGLAVLWKGLPALRVVWLPGALLLFAVPIPAALFNVVIYHFQLWTGQWSGWLLHGLGQAAFVSGDLILRPNDTFSIIEGCSGMRSVETLTMLSILLVDVLQRRGFHALALVLLAPLMAFALNGFRVLTLIFNPHSEIAAIHNLQGVVVLLCGLAGLLLVDALIERVVDAVSHSAPAGAAAESRPRAQPSHSSVSATTAVIGVSALFACMAASWLVPQFQPRVSVGLGLGRLLSAGIGDWKGSRLEIDREFLGSAWFREELYGRYRNEREAVDLFIGLGARAQRGRTFWSPKTGLPGSGWAVLEQGELEPAPGDTGARAGNWQLVSARARRVLVHHWYLGTAGMLDEVTRSLLALDSSPFEHTVDGLAVRISTELKGPGSTDLPAARARLRSFRQELQKELEALRSARPREAISHFSLSGKSYSVVLDLSQLQSADRTVTYGVPGGGTRLAIVDPRSTGVPRGLKMSMPSRGCEPTTDNGARRS